MWICAACVTLEVIDAIIHGGANGFAGLRRVIVL